MYIHLLKQLAKGIVVKCIANVSLQRCTTTVQDLGLDLPDGGESTTCVCESKNNDFTTLQSNLKLPTAVQTRPVSYPTGVVELLQTMLEEKNKYKFYFFFKADL